MRIVAVNFIFVFVAFGVSGQSNDLLDNFLDAEKADIGTSMLIIAQAAGELEPTATPFDGYQWAARQGFGRFMKSRNSSDPITLGVFYLALFHSLKVKTGTMFGLYRIPRYAVMGAKYLGYVDPSRAYYTRQMLPYEVLTGITYVQDDIALRRIKTKQIKAVSGNKKDEI